MKTVKCIIILASLLLAQCNQGFGVLTKKNYDLFFLDPCLGVVTTVAFTSPLEGTVVFGCERLIFTNTSMASTEVSVDKINWTPATSGTTAINEIAQFGTILEGENFSLYLRAGSACNMVRVALRKGDLTDFNSGIQYFLDTTLATGAGVNNDVQYFPVLIRLTQSFIIDAVRTDAPDVRFRNEDGTWLFYEIERWDQTNDVAELWVLVPTIYGNNAAHYIWMYYDEAVEGSIQDGQNPAGVFNSTNGNVGVWHMNNTPAGISGDIRDSTTNNMHGTSSGMLAIDQMAGQVAGSLSFDGIDNYISLGTSSSLQPANITVSFWIKRPTGVSWSGSSIMVLYAKPPGGYIDTAGWCFGIFDSITDQNKALYFAVDGVTSAGNAFFSAYDPDSYYPLDAWVYLTISFNSETNSWAIYYNGVQETIYGSENTPDSINGTSDEKLVGEESGYYWHGMMDELRISSVDRSADWVKLCYENQKTGQTLVK
ncbi:MAG: DUF2341 domain-containing protein [Spirochaetes bacterium]|nr:DUF2341 domain-containing protein [Spirochaetota bacterium]